MANITIGSKFKPFSYSELLHPVQLADEAHRNLENQYIEASTDTAMLENMLNKDLESKSYGLYRNYADSIKNQSTTLSEKGLQGTNRNDLIELKRSYSRDIIPIKQAYTKRLEEAKKQQELRLTDPTMIFNRDANTTSLDNYVNDPMLSYSSISGGSVTKQVGEALQNYKNLLTENGLWKKSNTGVFLEKLTRNGINPNDFQDIIEGVKYPEITKILNGIKESTMVGSWNNPTAEKHVDEALFKGLVYGIGKTDVKEAQNPDYIDAYKRWKMNSETAKSNSDKVHYNSVGVNLIADGQKYQENKKILEALDLAEKNIPPIKNYIETEHVGKYNDYMNRIMTEKSKSSKNNLMIKRMSAPASPNRTPRALLDFFDSPDDTRETADIKDISNYESAREILQETGGDFGKAREKIKANLDNSAYSPLMLVSASANSKNENKFLANALSFTDIKKRKQYVVDEDGDRLSKDDYRELIKTLSSSDKNLTIDPLKGAIAFSDPELNYGEKYYISDILFENLEVPISDGNKMITMNGSKVMKRMKEIAEKKGIKTAKDDIEFGILANSLIGSFTNNMNAIIPKSPESSKYSNIYAE